MKKAQDLREHLIDSVPALKKDPARLLMFIEKGSVACRAGSLSFVYRYRLTVTVTGYAEHADTLVIPLLVWLAQHQPELFQSPKSDDAFEFVAEIIDHKKSDVEFALDLTERVIVTTDEAGIHTATHCAEPPLPDLGGPTGWAMNPP